MKRQASSPGKLILSGEHAVVQGCPALAMAIDLEAKVSFKSVPENHLKISLPERQTRCFPLSELKKELANTRKAHAAFLEGELSFKYLMHEPETLLAVCAGLTDFSSGAELCFESNLPLGAGLGSSAAYILSLLMVLQPELSPNDLRKLAVEGENFQHGRSSGLDVAVSLQGGMLQFEKGKATPLSMTTPLPPFRVYHSGKPESSTGECVEQSQRFFSKHPSLKQDFSEVTGKTIEALLAQDLESWQSCVRENHRLLCQVGVVPASVQKAISLLEQSGCAAKVCGAGSVLGSAAGMVLVLGDDPQPLPESWQRLPLNLSLSGTRILT